MSLESKVLQFLEDMGPDADTVATWLRGQGIKGHRGMTSYCPVAYALRRTFPDSRVAVRALTIIVGDTLMRPPAAVTEFICGFDTGRYPDLQAPLTLDTIGWVMEVGE